MFQCLMNLFTSTVFIGELWMVALHYHQHQDCKPLPDPQKCTRRILDQALREIAPLNMDCGTVRNSDGETSVNNVDMKGSQEVTTDAVSTRGLDCSSQHERQLDHNATFMFLLLSFKREKMLWIHVKGSCLTVIYAHEVASNWDDCSTSETHQSGTCGRRSPRSRSHATGERSRRKRWRGRVERLEVTPDFSFVETSRTGSCTLTWSV